MSNSPIDAFKIDSWAWRFLERPEDYVEASRETERVLSPASTARQFRSAAEILRRLTEDVDGEAQRGILLADDVGLGKTTVAALVAWVVASAFNGRTVRILAPNDTLMRRWADELRLHVPMLNAEATHLTTVSERRVKTGKVTNLRAGTIQVVKHSYASGGNRLSCDLLIVDEAHRAKGDQSDFAKELREQKRHAKRVLVLTATPFSIRLDEFKRMLSLVGGESAGPKVGDYQRELDRLYTGSTARKSDVVADRLATCAAEAVAAISPYVIRHGIDQLPEEQQAFGDREDWSIDVPSARADEIELMLRMDRLLRLLKDANMDLKGATNDPRFHVGWKYFDRVLGEVEHAMPKVNILTQRIAGDQIETIKKQRRKVAPHSKLTTVGESVNAVANSREKVVLFCHHHATAQELALHLDQVIPAVKRVSQAERQAWQAVWTEVLAAEIEATDAPELLDVFITWLTGDLQIRQMESWLVETVSGENTLAKRLCTEKARHKNGAVTIAEAALALFKELVRSKSTKAVLSAARNDPALLPGGARASKVFATCRATNEEQHRHLFLRNQQPDAVMAIFNSPFGPEVLVVTDQLSEGVDLHRYCRHLVHYELDPSPIRTVQRNGRLRRVNGWGAVIGEPIRYAYPALRGTRDHRLVAIMKKRLDSFSLLLGGVQDFQVDTTTERDEAWRAEVVQLAKRKLEGAGKALCV
jgi:ERCC4-related helicase